MLFRKTKKIVTLLCTDNLFNVIPESIDLTASAIEKRFDCDGRSFISAAFNVRDILPQGRDIVLSQMAYFDTEDKDTNPPIYVTKLELQRELNNENKSKHLIAFGRLAWVSTGTSPTSHCLSVWLFEAKQKPLILLKIYL